MFTSHVHGLLCFLSCTTVLVGLRIGQEVFKVLSLVYSKKRKPTVSYAPYSEQAFPFVQSTTGAARTLSRPVTDPPDHSPSLATKLKVPRVYTFCYDLVKPGFFKEAFFHIYKYKKKKLRVF